MAQEGVGDCIHATSFPLGFLNENSFQAHAKPFHASPGRHVELVCLPDYPVYPELLEGESEYCLSDLGSVVLTFHISMKDHPDLALSVISCGAAEVRHRSTSRTLLA
jgi:hypothetical protein